jgi:hypothetical protein
MDMWHAGRTEAERLASNLKRTDAAVCNLWTATGPRPSHLLPRRGPNVSDEQIIARTTLTKLQKASITRIL